MRYRNVKSVDVLYAAPQIGVKGQVTMLVNPVRGRILADVTVQFGQNLRKIRLSKEISQERLAELAGLHRTYVSSIERGERNISLINVERLSIALGLSMAELMPDYAERKSKRR